jgi:hypothetical protein
LAVLTYGIFHNGIENTALPTFYRRAPAIFQTAERIPGFITIAGDKSDRAEPHSSFLADSDTIGSSEVLSLWTHLEPLYAFAYNGLHAEALHKRGDWFVKAPFPAYVLWWVADDHVSDWHEAYARHEHLHQHGATAVAFDFKHPFDAEGSPLQVDRLVAKSIAQSLDQNR